MQKQHHTLTPKPTLLVISLAGMFAAHAHAATTSDSFSGLGILPGYTGSYGVGVSSDGSVVVGYFNNSTGGEAFRWTQAGGMQGLGIPSGYSGSYAQGVSSDGSVVVGAVVGGNNDQAFRWTQATGMVKLGFLTDYSESYAYGVSSDGSVVVGAVAGGSNTQAFRWTQAGGMQGLGFLANSISSQAYGISSDGSTVVGVSGSEAFRWTQATGMVGLGFLPGGDSSTAIGVSADGSVVVGTANITANGSGVAFRWTQAGGMQSVAAWLAAAKVAVPAGWALTAAAGTNSDGSVVVGLGTDPSGNSEAFLARVSPVGSGIINPAAFNQSVINTGASVSLAGANLPELSLEGAHHRTLMDSGITRSAGDGVGVWATADAAHFNSSNSDLNLTEVGVYKDLGTARIGIGAGQVWDRQSLDLGGNASYNGQYGLIEVDNLFTPHVEGSMLGYWGNFGTNVSRNYQNGNDISTSKGYTTTTSTAVRLRVDLLNLATLGKLSLSPYAAYTWQQAHVGAYTEVGGGFPVSYNGDTSTDNNVRVGAETKTALTGTTELVLNTEMVHCMESNTSGVGGQVIGLGGFAVPGQSVRQNWVRVMADLDHHLTDKNLVTVGVNAATQGGDPSYGGTISYHAVF